MLKIIQKIRSFLRNSSHFHIHEVVLDVRALVEVIDRFLDRRALYPLEWDDFVSWEHINPTIEGIRLKIAETEPLFFSGSIEDKRRGFEIILEQRNYAAALVGLPSRLDYKL